MMKNKNLECKELVNMIVDGVSRKTMKKNAINASIQAYDIKLAIFETDEDVKKAVRNYVFVDYYCPLCEKYNRLGVCGNCPLKDEGGNCCAEWKDLTKQKTRAALIKLAERINSLEEKGGQQC